MKNNISFLKLILLTAGAIVFNIVFWQEKIAVNAIFFDAFILGAVFYLYPAAFAKPQMKWLVLAHIIALGTVVYHNTMLSKIAFSTTLLLVVVFTQYLHRSVWYAAASVLSNYVLVFFSMLDGLQQVKFANIKSTGLRKALRFAIIPLFIAAVFFVVYSLANTIFQNAIGNAALAVQNFAAKLFSWFKWERFVFLLLGLLITGGLLLRSKYNGFSEKDITQHNDLWRKKNNLRRWKNSALYDLLTVFMGKFANGVLALRNENTVGIISLVMLNILLLAINSIDIMYVWFGFTYTPDTNLKDIVHEGTGLLIFSIVLAVAVVLFFFRGNLNFYKKNKWLRYGAYGWIFQNALLVISVLLRDYYYIQHMGLAYKRIGVLFFLLMVLFGLFTVFVKIYQKKTGYYLWRVNGWFGIVLLVAASCIHWDETMATYNLARKNTVPVDVNFLLTLSDKTLPLLQANPDVLDKPEPYINGEGAYLNRSAITPRQQFEMRKQEFLELQQQYTWLSWNRADAFVKEKFTALKQTSMLQK
jgi:Domain of unknown function (DUF4173)